METAVEMSRAISNFSNSDYGVGITGKLNRVDTNNPYGEDNMVFVSIYDKDSDQYHNFKVEATEENRILNKEKVIKKIEGELLSLLG